jgi:hypothetical protein
MRVNHTGEVCAQALYAAQAAVARDPSVAARFASAAREEEGPPRVDPVRALAELDDRPSLLNPLWYAGSFAIGTIAGLIGDRVNLGFVVETERQVEEHLTTHLDRLPERDAKSRAIVDAMRADEARHGAMAYEAGGTGLPPPGAEPHARGRQRHESSRLPPLSLPLLERRQPRGPHCSGDRILATVLSSPCSRCRRRSLRLFTPLTTASASRSSCPGA